MLKKKVLVSDISRNHENPIAELVQVACRYDSEITLECDNRKINAKSIMGVMAFNPIENMAVEIAAEGNDEQDALNAIEEFLVS